MPDAIRNPKRGKAHRRLGPWGVTICRDSAAGYEFFRTLTEVIPVERTDPADRCKRCWGSEQGGVGEVSL